ncbi:hypothetical protein BDF21DRAFT_420794 [Thamnidium elegans]|nr:hypothetical protein BDF21DRAFT_420794 [Thamnidium elegans]
MEYSFTRLFVSRSLKLLGRCLLISAHISEIRIVSRSTFRCSSNPCILSLITKVFVKQEASRPSFILLKALQSKHPIISLIVESSASKENRVFISSLILFLTSSEVIDNEFEVIIFGNATDPKKLNRGFPTEITYNLIKTCSSPVATILPKTAFLLIVRR